MIADIVAWSCVGIMVCVTVAYGIWYFKSGAEGADGKDKQKDEDDI